MGRFSASLCIRGKTFDINCIEPGISSICSLVYLVLLPPLETKAQIRESPCLSKITQLVSTGYFGVLIQVCRYDFIQALAPTPLALLNPPPLVFSLHLRKIDGEALC